MVVGLVVGLARVVVGIIVEAIVDFVVLISMVVVQIVVRCSIVTGSDVVANVVLDSSTMVGAIEVIVINGMVVISVDAICCCTL